MLMKIKLRYFLLMLLCIGNVFLTNAQSKRQVTGRVMDAKGELLIGVNVMEVGTTNGTVTDTNGTYKLSVTSKDAKIK